MQFALPPRKSVPGTRSSRIPHYRRKQLKPIAIFALVFLSITYVLFHFSSSSSSSVAPAATTGLVIVTLLDYERFSDSYIDKIVANREDYAKRHGKLFQSLVLTYSPDFTI
jgi:mannan polymerase II complex MNN11 subunit